MTWQSSLTQHPQGASSSNPDFWEQFFADNPAVLHRLLADVYTAVYGTDKPPTLDQLWDVMSTPRFSTEEFGPAVIALLRGRSIRWLASKIGVAHVTIYYQISGRRPIIQRTGPGGPADVAGSMKRIEAVAQALEVHPSYFVEWRRLWIMSLLDAAFTAQPGLSIGVFRRYAGFDGARGNGRSDG